MVMHINLGKIAPAGDFRTPLTEDLTVFVRQDGDDAADGLTEATAKATFASCFDLLGSFDPVGARVFVDVGEGEFAFWDYSALPAGYHEETLFIVGKGTDKTSISGLFNLGSCSVTDLCFPNGAVVPMGATVLVRRDDQSEGVIRLGGQLRIVNSLLDLFKSTLEFYGEMRMGIFADGGQASVTCHAGTVFRAVDSPHFTEAFMACARGATISLYVAEFEGTAIGRKYSLYQGGRLTGQGANVRLETLLGSEPGVIDPVGYMASAGIARAGASISSNGTVYSNNNIASVTNTAPGAYDIAFVRPFQDAWYVVTVSPEWSGGTDTAEAGYGGKTEAGFIVYTKTNGTPANLNFSFACF